MTEKETIDEVVEHYSRRSRSGKRGRRNQTDAPVLQELVFPKVSLWPIVIWSLLISMASVANPYLLDLADASQTQSLYATMAVQAGQLPYSQFLGNSGILYYGLLHLGTLLGTSWGLIVLEFMVLLGSGFYFSKIAAFLSGQEAVARQLVTWFYLFVMALGFGGLYASVFALPLVLASLWFLVRYLNNAVRDEGFILYGIRGALVFLIDPLSSLLWVLASVVLLVVNISRRQKARGLYQLLASLFGFLLIVYAVGYFVLIKQILGAAVQQTFFTYLAPNFQRSDLLQDALVAVVVLAVTGIFRSWLVAFGFLKEEKYRSVTSLLLLTVTVFLPILFMQANFVWSDLIGLLPYGLLLGTLSSLPKEDGADIEEDSVSLFNYAKMNLYLPFLVILALAARPAIYFFQDAQLSQERQAIAHYIQEKTAETDLIYAWDQTAHLYLDSHRLSASSSLLPSESSKNQLIYDLRQEKASYIVVNKKLSLPAEVTDLLEGHYKAIDLGTTDFLVYQKD